MYFHLRERWKEERMFQLSIAAGIQATLHNAHFEHEKGKPFLPFMFMPGYKPPRQSWQQQKQMAQMMSGGLKTKMSPEELRRMNEGAEIFKQRAERARQLQEEGAPADKVRAVMEGVQ